MFEKGGDPPGVKHRVGRMDSRIKKRRCGFNGANISFNVTLLTPTPPWLAIQTIISTRK
jgi:hypothetical protein